jgi:eukaryotic-like serine/threonine-protein kinase
MQQDHFNRRYTLHDRIGTGGMGTVYRATDHLTGQDVALKLVNTAPSDAAPHLSTRDRRARLADEFRLLAALDHPHIIRVADYGVARDQPFFTMQLLRHPQSIVDAARDRDLQGTLRLLVQTLHAIDYLHQRGILHRDIKPSNILVDDDHSYLLDFGLAVDQPEVTPLGTLLYIAPEMLRGKPTTRATDIYALGCVFIEMLSGRPVFDLPPDAGNTALINAILLHPPDLNQLIPGPASPDNPDAARLATLRDLLQAMIRHDPAKRLTDTTVLLEKFSALLDTPLNLAPDAVLQAVRFVGRQAELDQLQAALDHVQEAMRDVWAFVAAGAYGQAVGSVWLVGGESGVGKTRLLGHVAARALTEDYLVLQGRAQDGGDPLAIWRDVLRRLVLALDITAEEAAALRGLIPDVDRLTGHDHSTPPPLDPPAALRGTVLALFRRLNEPTLLLLDDIQWAARGLLHDLLAAVPDLPVVVVAGFRDDEYAALYEEFADANHLRLGRLTRADIAALLGSLLGEAAPTATVEWLMRQTEGNSFFLIETLRTLALEHGLRHAITHRPSQVASIMPKEVFPLLERRLQHLDADDTHLLQMAATLGYELDLAVLHCLNDFQPLEGWLTRCTAAGLLTTRNARWQFIHDKLRVAVLHRIPADDKASLYRAVAIAKSSLHSENVHEAQQLMALWQVAGNTLQVYRYAVHAARHARQNADFSNASRLYYAAREKRRYVSCRLLLEHADVLFQLGDLTAALLSAEEAQQKAATNSDLICTAHITYHRARLYLARHQYEEVVAFADDALRLYRKLKLPREAAYCLVLLGTAYAEMGSVRAAQGYHQDALDAFNAQQDIPGMIEARLMLGLDAYLHDDLKIAQDHFDAAQTLATTHNHPDGVAQALFHSSAVLLARGRVLAAVAQLVQALEMVEVQGQLAFQAQIKARLAHCYRKVGETQLARRHYADALRDSLRIGMNQTATFEVLVGVGHLAVADGDAALAAQVIGHLEQHTATTQFTRQALDVLREAVYATLAPVARASVLAEGAALSTRALIDAAQAALQQASAG